MDEEGKTNIRETKENDGIVLPSLVLQSLERMTVGLHLVEEQSGEYKARFGGQQKNLEQVVLGEGCIAMVPHGWSKEGTGFQRDEQ